MNKPLLYAALALGASATLGASASLAVGENELVVRWHGDYYRHLWDDAFPGGTDRDFLENRWLRGGPALGAQLSEQGVDLDGDGDFDDSRVWFDFSLEDQLNPRTTPQRPNGVYYHGDLRSALFYGGLSAQFYNYQTERIQQAFIENDGAGGDLADVGYPSPYTAPEFQGLQDFVEGVRAEDGRYRKTHVGPHEDFAINLYRPDQPHPIDPADDAADNLVAFQAAFVWRKADFLEGGDALRVSLDAGSEFSFESTRWWDNIDEARWIVQDDDGSLYISQYAVPGRFDTHGHTNTFSDPLGSLWAPYTPSGADLAFDAESATWVDPVTAGLFTDLQALGMYIASDTPSGELTRFSLDDIRFNAVVADVADPILAGDYDANGVVDAADYTVWRDNQGAPAGTLPNDASGEPIGATQYDAWAANFGATEGASEAAAVPEPAAAALALFAAFSTGPGRRRHATCWLR